MYNVTIVYMSFYHYNNYNYNTHIHNEYIYLQQPSVTMWRGCNHLSNQVANICRRLNLPYSIRFLTPGDGSCFFHAIVEAFTSQQLWNLLSPHQKAAVANHLSLRRAVADFIGAVRKDDMDPRYRLLQQQIQGFVLNRHRVGKCRY